MEKGGELGAEMASQRKKMMRTDTFPFRVPAGPTIEDDCSGIGIRRAGSDLYLYGGAAATAAAAAVAAASAATTSALQPFPTPPTPTTSAFGSPGMATASFRFPFTLAQWQELERQAMIFKYMMASVPIPPDLLVPKGFTDAPASHHPALGRGSCFNLRFSNSVDPEPGRCRRTDGKKWRCSRDVAPDQKYCERHMHRGRPRSRKHVEVQSHTSHTRGPIPSTTPTSSLTSTPANPNHPNLINGATGFPSQHPSAFFTNKSPFLPEKEQPRYVDWMNGGSESMASSQAWQLMEPEMGLKTGDGIDPILVRPPYEDNLSLSFSGFGSGSSGPEQNDQCCLFLNSDLSSIEDPIPKDPPLRFIDAWSISPGEPATSSISAGKAEICSGGKFPLSSLTLSMHSCEDDEQVHMGLGVPDSDGESNGGKHATLSWTSPIPLLGGPLGEVLQSTTPSAGSNSLSPHSCGGLNLMADPCAEGCSPHDSPTRQASSPTGVLRKTLASFSDSSGCSSPTFVAAKLPGQIAFLN